MNADYETVRKQMVDNGWINKMHTIVPGTDGKFSFGGMCFPKDVNALNSFLEENNLHHGLIDALINEREKFRDD